MAIISMRAHQTPMDANHRLAPSPGPPLPLPLPPVGFDSIDGSSGLAEFNEALRFRDEACTARQPQDPVSMTGMLLTMLTACRDFVDVGFENETTLDDLREDLIDLSSA